MLLAIGDVLSDETRRAGKDPEQARLRRAAERDVDVGPPVEQAVIRLEADPGLLKVKLPGVVGVVPGAGAE